MNTVKYFEDLRIWKNARILSKEIYQITKRQDVMKNNRFVGQILSASGSVMDNIAEGFERNGNGEFKQFLYIAKGSCGEVRSQLSRAYDYQYINNEEYKELLQLSLNLSVSISNLIRHLKDSNNKGAKYKTESSCQ